MTKFQDYLLRVVILAIAVVLAGVILAFTAFIVLLAQGKLV